MQRDDHTLTSQRQRSMDEGRQSHSQGSGEPENGHLAVGRSREGKSSTDEPRDAIGTQAIITPPVEITPYRQIAKANADLFAHSDLSSTANKIGRIFTIPTTNEQTTRQMDYTTQITASEVRSALGERVSQRDRKLIAVHLQQEYCYAVPIMTYEGRGVSKTGVKKSEHAIVYTSKQPPSLLPAEMPIRGEEPIKPTPIRVKSADLTEKLSDEARINFGKIYKIGRNVKVKRWGHVYEHSMQALLSQWRSVSREMASTMDAESGTSNTSPAARPQQLDFDREVPRSSSD